MAVASPKIRLWSYPSTLILVGFDALVARVLDNLDLGGATGIRFATDHFHPTPIVAVSHNYTSDKYGLLISGTEGAD